MVQRRTNRQFTPKLVFQIVAEILDARLHPLRSDVLGGNH